MPQENVFVHASLAFYYSSQISLLRLTGVIFLSSGFPFTAM